MVGGGKVAMKSKDYKKLYELICNGEAVAAFVDYKFRQIDEHVFRDVCQVVKKKEFDIQFFARGIGYGGIYQFMQDDGVSEFDVFVKICESMNLEFFNP